ncbi:MAG: MarR family winged helix-turn-helix transcriptional regulator [Candidatus Methanoculleus thermohydrogenotrophicum]|jgi:DNA-binding MarR family transcriptional regulator|nr:MarR family winged helix-turn-helix transcriptional regulator [Candidatus Methanoculleus thermohydrogenotrophicum]NLM81624.1 winged helix-turn-helix transcriptional regulator [Candidatus Methanoculleus thermohydrogenotrophicum]HQC92167.1 MarR family winged helix-turn-helix transcriptional regulator [Candidatus Methanoculleus thermohydrogenotrophicum]
MSARVERLFEVFERLFTIKDECSCEILSECGLGDMTAKQIAYLKAIDEHGDVTFSRLAEITGNSKPTITEMVDRFVRMECAYRQKSPDDGRVTYIRLTEKGRMVANAEENALHRMIKRIMRTLDENEVDLLVEILKKVG